MEQPKIRLEQLPDGYQVVKIAKYGTEYHIYSNRNGQDAYKKALAKFKQLIKNT